MPTIPPHRSLIQSNCPCVLTYSRLSSYLRRQTVRSTIKQCCIVTLPYSLSTHGPSPNCPSPHYAIPYHTHTHTETETHNTLDRVYRRAVSRTTDRPKARRPALLSVDRLSEQRTNFGTNFRSERTNLFIGANELRERALRTNDRHFYTF